MSPKPASLSVAFSFAVLTATAAFAGDARAQACGMGDIDWYRAEHEAVSRAEDRLQQGEPQKAASLLQRMWPRLREAVPVESTLPVIADGVRLMALAAVRTDGDVPASPGWSSGTPRERALNVAWGVQRLRMLEAATPGSAVAKTALGEALARSPSTREEGLSILEALDDSDEIATPEGYAAFALALRQAGEVAGAEAATEQCFRQATFFRVQCAPAVGDEASIVAAAR
jgi:hypothetical protein